MRLERLELAGFKSFAKTTTLIFDSSVVAIVGPNGSGKSNIAEACRWVLGEQSLKSLRGRRGEDFIWHGSSAAARANRAAAVLTFDNQDARWPLEAATVAISRVVDRDGVNTYSLNQSAVRLKDLIELLHKVSLGPSGYHIISQGEADKILISSPVERRQIIESALGLRLYQWQLTETEKKLEKTDDNLRQVELLRREIAPHLRFLKKEMEKIAKTRDLRRELKTLALDYFSRQAADLAAEKTALGASEVELKNKIKRLTERLSQFERAIGEESVEAKQWQEQLRRAEQNLRALLAERETLSRRLGRIEGRLEVAPDLAESSQPTVAARQVREWVESLEAVAAQGQNSDDLNLIRAAWTKIKQIVEEIKQIINLTNPMAAANQSRSESKQEQAALAVEIEKVGQLTAVREGEVVVARHHLELEATSRGEAQAARLQLKFELASEHSKLDAVKAARERWQILQADFDRELAEAVALTDRELLDYSSTPTPVGISSAQKSEQEAKHRRLERLKLQLEEAGVGSSEVATEYEQAAAREEHLSKEVVDLTTSIAALEKISAELKEKINSEFKTGLARINREFQDFFNLLFGGGRVELQIVAVREDEDQPSSFGLEIDLSLPRKRIRGLEMLSGGERSLTAIALLFALSRVRPPPFMILDETDAALDEANSRKYGEMVTALGQQTQLILITHNRETMSRADAIYGVTMGADGVSRLLSIKFDQAVEFAK